MFHACASTLCLICFINTIDVFLQQFASTVARLCFYTVFYLLHFHDSYCFVGILFVVKSNNSCFINFCNGCGGRRNAFPMVSMERSWPVEWNWASQWLLFSSLSWKQSSKMRTRRSRVNSVAPSMVPSSLLITGLPCGSTTLTPSDLWVKQTLLRLGRTRWM